MTTSVFSNIDARLTSFATELNAVLKKDRDGISTQLFGFEERRIDWQKNGINLAIIIQNDFRATGVDTTKWNLVNVAWYYDGPHRHTVQRYLAKSNAFLQIEERIEALLQNSFAYLNQLQKKDLEAPTHPG